MDPTPPLQVHATFLSSKFCLSHVVPTLRSAKTAKESDCKELRRTSLQETKPKVA
jgi:hypothetical protein